MNDKLTPGMIRKAAKRLHRKLKCEKPYTVEVENPIERTDFLRVIDKKGDTKQICVKPTLLL